MRHSANLSNPNLVGHSIALLDVPALNQYWVNGLCHSGRAPFSGLFGQQQQNDCYTFYCFLQSFFSLQRLNVKLKPFNGALLFGAKRRRILKTIGRPFTCRHWSQKDRTSNSPSNPYGIPSPSRASSLWRTWASLRESHHGFVSS